MSVPLFKCLPATTASQAASRSTRCSCSCSKCQEFSRKLGAAALKALYKPQPRWRSLFRWYKTGIHRITIGAFLSVWLGPQRHFCFGAAVISWLSFMERQWKYLKATNTQFLIFMWRFVSSLLSSLGKLRPVGHTRPLRLCNPARRACAN